MTLRDAANNLAQLCIQLDAVDAVREKYSPLNNAPHTLLQLAVEDVIQALDTEGTQVRALLEIERVSGYASDTDVARIKMLAWVHEAARLAQQGVFLPEPERAGSLKPGDVLVKAGPFPPNKGK